VNHTPEPWRVGNGIDVQAAGNAVLAYVSTAGARGRTLEEARANGERIAACVNFCAGFSDEELRQATLQEVGVVASLLLTAALEAHTEILKALTVRAKLTGIAGNGKLTEVANHLEAAIATARKLGLKPTE
jgi:hypothetical protein